MSYYVLFNPLSSNGNSKEYLNIFKSKYANVLVDIINIIELEDIIGFLKSLNPSDEIVIVGGDGTINRFINSIRGYDLKNNVYLYAAGSGNDFLRDMDMLSINDLVLLNPHMENLPVVTIDGKEEYFINGIGYGIDGYCCTVGLEKALKTNKPVNYTLIALKLLLLSYRPRNAKITVDGITKEYKKVWLAPTMKGRFYGGGMMICPTQDRTDGYISLVVVHNCGKLRVLTAFPKIFKGKHIKYKKIVEIIKGKEIIVEFDEPCDLQIDGEGRYGVKKYLAKV